MFNYSTASLYTFKQPKERDRAPPLYTMWFWVSSYTVTLSEKSNTYTRYTMNVYSMNVPDFPELCLPWIMCYSNSVFKSGKIRFLLKIHFPLTWVGVPKTILDWWWHVKSNLWYWLNYNWAPPKYSVVVGSTPPTTVQLGLTFGAWNCQQWHLELSIQVSSKGWMHTEASVRWWEFVQLFTGLWHWIVSFTVSFIWSAMHYNFKR